MCRGNVRNAHIDKTVKTLHYKLPKWENTNYNLHRGLEKGFSDIHMEGAEVGLNSDPKDTKKGGKKLCWKEMIGIGHIWWREMCLLTE